MPPKRPLVVIPALNEEETLARTIADVREHAPMCTIVVVDDGSVDRTVQIAENAAVPVLKLPINLGVGGAMRCGFRYAAQRGFDAVVQVDADGQHRAEDVPRLLEELDRADVVVGARFAGRGEYKTSPLRRATMWMLAAQLSSWSKVKLTDTSSGFRASGPRAISIYSRYYPVEYLGDTVESLAIAIRAKLRITQIAVEMNERQGGKPSQSWASSVFQVFRAGLVLILARTRHWPDLQQLAGERNEAP